MSHNVNVQEFEDIESSLPKFTRKGRKIVYMSEILYACFKVEMDKLKDQYLETSSYQTIFKFQEAAAQLGRDYDITVNVQINYMYDVLHPDVTIDVEEEISLIPGSEEEHRIFTQKVYGHNHISDIELFNKESLTSRETKILDGEL